MDARAIHVGRGDAVFTLYAPDATAVLVDGTAVPFTRSGNFVSRGAGTPARTPSRLAVSAYPQPFTSGVTFAIDSPGHVSGDAVVYDVRGHRVRRVWAGMLAAEGPWFFGTDRTSGASQFRRACTSCAPQPAPRSR